MCKHEPLLNRLFGYGDNGAKALLGFIVFVIFVAGLLSFAIRANATVIQSIPDTLENGQPNPEFYKWDALPAKVARQEIMRLIYNQHTEAINWWVEYINAEVLKQSRNGSACIGIEVTKANMEVQGYLVDLYTKAGYYQPELTPGWDGEHNRPDGHTYLSLSW